MSFKLKLSDRPFPLVHSKSTDVVFENFEDEEESEVKQLGTTLIFRRQDHYDSSFGNIDEMSLRVEKLPPTLKQRLIDSLHKATDISDDSEHDRCVCIKSCCLPSHSVLTREDVPLQFSIPYKIGLNMSKELFFPALPYFLRDIWIMIELLVTFVQVVLAVLGIPNASNLAVTSAFISLATVNALLALLDAGLYYYELGSYKYMCKKCTKNKDEPSDNIKCCKWIHLSENKKKFLNQWFEVIRTVLSELLLYPLIVFDLYDVGRSGFFNSTLDLSIFLISTFYMVLSVYLARIIIAMFTLKTLLQLLSNTTTQSSNIRFMVRFFAHIIVQVIAHMTCIIAVGLKVHQENSKDDGYSATPFLWGAIIGGWLIPFFGVVIFFLANYFWTQQYCVGLFIEMMSLIQVPNIAQTLSDVKSDTTLKAQEILEKMQFSKLKREYREKLDKARTITKLIYPGKIFLFLCLAILYSMLLVSFFVCLLLGNDQNGHVIVVDINEGTNIFIVVCVVIIAVTNIHILLLTPCLPAITLYAFCKRY